MDRTVAALSICADKLRRRHVSLSRAVATEACRRASNGEQLAERVRRETGIVLDIIQAAEEATVAVLDRKSVVEGKRVSVRVNPGGRPIHKKKKLLTRKA